MSSCSSNGEVEALLLAGGTGSRLAELSDGIPKPLVKLGGRAIAELAVRALSRTGVRRCTMLTRYQQTSFEPFAQRLRTELGMQIRCFPFEGPKLEHILLALRASPAAYALLMDADSFFDERILAQLMEKTNSGDILIAVQGQANADPVVWTSHESVRISRDANNNVLNIGRNSEKHDAIDTGLQLWRSDLARELSGFLSSDHDSRDQSSFIRSLVDNHQIRAIDIGSLDWVGIDHPSDFRRAESLLERSDLARIRKLPGADAP